MVDMENIAYQRFVVTVYDPSIALSVEEPESITFAAGQGEVTEDIAIQAYAGMAGGYKLDYYFDDADLVCEVDATYRIPSVVTEGELSGTSWGYGVTDSPGEVPPAWSPIVTTPTILKQSDNPTSFPYDEFYLAFGVKVDLTAAACKYGNTLRITLTSNF